MQYDTQRITYRGALRAIEEGNTFYAEVLSEHVECTYSTRLICGIQGVDATKRPATSIMHNFWSFHVDEYIKPRFVKSAGRINLWRTGPDGKREFVSTTELKYPEPNSLKIVFPDTELWKTTKVDYECEFLILTKPAPPKTTFEDKYQESEETDIALEFGGKQFYVNKELLASNSEYFRQLFTKPTGCRVRKKTVKKVKATLEEFGMLLSTFHPPHVECIKDIQVEQLLELAERFQLPNVTEKIEAHLINLSIMEKHKILWLADKHNLQNVIDEVLKKISDWDLRMAKYRRYYSEISEETKAKVAKKLEKQKIPRG